MKLIFAGPEFSKPLRYELYLYNCLRNPRCQKKYFVPITRLDELQFYAELTGPPILISATLFDLCEEDCVETPGDFSDDFNDDFDIGGEACTPKECDIIFQQYVVGQTPQGKWYGVFAQPFSSCVPKCFFIRFVFEISGRNYIYYSQQICIETGCDTLCLLQGCYPNEPVGSDAYDCNGVYYGFPAGDGVVLGTRNFRYFHKAYVRKCSIIDRSLKLSFSYFNSKMNYKTQQSREQLLEFELVPGFYKDELAGIFARGNIRINNSEYRLAEEQTWQVLDYDAKLWQLDTILADECKLLFGCAPADCLLPADECKNNLEMGEWSFAETGELHIPLIGDFAGAMGINWELYEVDPIGGAKTLVNSGAWFLPPDYIIVDDVDPTTKCYLVKWQVDCGYSQSEWKEEQFGKCDQEAGITGTVAMYSYGAGKESGSEQCRAQGWTKLRFRFSGALPTAISIQVAYVYSLVAGTPVYAFGEGHDILDPAHPDYAAAWSNTGKGKPFDITIPAGTTDYLTPMLYYASPYFPVDVAMVSFPGCNPSWGFKYFAKLYFRVITPTGQILTLVPVFDTPSPYNTQVNAFTMVQVP